MLPQQPRSNPKRGWIDSPNSQWKLWQPYTVPKQGRSLILNLGKKEDINADHHLMKKLWEPYTVCSWGRRKTPSIDKGKISQRMWKSAVIQHPRAHSTQFLNAIAKESCTNKNGERTDSPSICAWGRLTDPLRESEQLRLCMRVSRQWREWRWWFFLTNVRSTCWWSVHVRKDWQSCHTPLPAITASTTQQNIKVVVG